jgi:hypothetical protein
VCTKPYSAPLYYLEGNAGRAATATSFLEAVTEPIWQNINVKFGYVRMRANGTVLITDVRAPPLLTPACILAKPGCGDITVGAGRAGSCRQPLDICALQRGSFYACMASATRLVIDALLLLLRRPSSRRAASFLTPSPS